MEFINGESNTKLVVGTIGNGPSIQIHSWHSKKKVDSVLPEHSALKKTSAENKEKGREKPVICTINFCGRRFSSDNSLRNHIRRKHSSRALMGNRLADLHRPSTAYKPNNNLRIPLQRAAAPRKLHSNIFLPPGTSQGNFSPQRLMRPPPNAHQGSPTLERNTSHEAQLAVLLNQIQQKGSSRYCNESPRGSHSPTNAQALLAHVTEKPYCDTVDELKDLIANRICEISIKLACNGAQVRPHAHHDATATSIFGSPGTEGLPTNEGNFLKRVTWPIEGAGENWFGKPRPHGQWAGCNGLTSQLMPNGQSHENVY